MNRPRRLPQAAVAIVFALFGLLLTTSAGSAPDVRAARRAQLTDLVTERQQEVAGLNQTAADLRAGLDAANRAAATADAGVAAERAAGDALAPQAGLTPMTGPGVTVTLKDAPAPPAGQPLPTGVSYDDLVVHQQDVQAVVNALWAGGAEGVSIMGRRIVATSAVRCVGNTLILQGRVYSPPYSIAAVGDPAALRGSLAADRQVSVYREWAGVVGLGYDVTQSQEVALPAYDGPLQLRSAEAIR